MKPMVIWYGPGNGFHSNVTDAQWADMYRSRVGLEAIGKSGVKVSVSYQSIDYVLMPWLRETLAKYPNIEVLNAPHSHAMIPFQTEEMRAWELSKVVGTAPVTFCAEFFNPEERFIPTEGYIVLAGHTYLYSDCSGRSTGDIETEQLPSAPAIKREGKIGIIMREKLFNPILNAFFRFQLNPITADEKSNHKDPLENLLDEIEKVRSMPEDTVVVWPIDIEAPWVGSVFGADIWKMLFEGIVRRGLSDVFTSFTDVFPMMREKAVSSKKPQRKLVKWTAHMPQLNYLMRLNSITDIKGDRKKRLMSIASCSDILSAMDSKIQDSKEPVMRAAKDRNGNDIKIHISYNQDIISVQLAAILTLEKGGRFADQLAQVGKQEKRELNSLFIQRMLAVAGEYDI